MSLETAIDNLLLIRKFVLYDPSPELAQNNNV